MPEWLDIGIFGLTIFFMLVGLFGLIVPLFPGMVVIWLAALGYGFAVGFDLLGGILFGVITVLFIVAVTIDNVLMGAKAHREGASWSSLLLGMLAGVLGTIFFPPIGGFIAAPLAILLLEYARQRDWRKALNALRGLAVGWGTAFLVRFFLGGAMIGLWLLWALLK